MKRTKARLIPLLVLIILRTGQAEDPVARPTTRNYFYREDAPPRTLLIDEGISLYVNTATSSHTLNEIDYYDLPVCRPTEGIAPFGGQNLGQDLDFQKIQNSPYQILMKREMFCNLLCQVKPSEQQVRKMRFAIENGYHHNWILDNLPSASIGTDVYGMQKIRYSGGFPIGFIAINGLPYVYNHVNIHIAYQNQEPGYRLVGFAVEPLSVSRTVQRDYEWKNDPKENFQASLDTCSSSKHLSRDEIRRSQVLNNGVSILYSYDVIWERRDVKWSRRWEAYLSEDNLVPKQVHVYSAANSIVVVLFLVILLVAALRKQVFRDLGAYSNGYLEDIENDEDAVKLGWMLLHADVFRPPKEYELVFATLIGTGAELTVKTLVILVKFNAGLISPARRGSFLLSTLHGYSGIVAGYVSTRLYQTMGGKKIIQSSIATASFFPGLVLFYFLVRHSTSEVGAPLASLATALVLYGGLNAAMVVLGAYIASRKDPIPFPVATSPNVRPIPPPKKCLHRFIFGPLVIGGITFAASYVELFFVMTSLWMQQTYYEPLFALIIFTIMLIICGLATMLVVYLRLRMQNHRWWWFSFFCAGSTGVYVFVYSMLWMAKLKVTTFSAVISYVVGMFVICVGIACLFGSVGFLASLGFTMTIYRAINPRDEATDDVEISSTTKTEMMIPLTPDQANR